MKRIIFGLLFVMALLLAACSSNSESRDSASGGESSADRADFQAKEEMNNASQTDDGAENNKTTEAVVEAEIKAIDRMVIYNADLRLEVKDFKKSQGDVEALIKKMGGYVVRSEVYDSEKGRMEGSITVRVPQDHFQSFLDKSEEMSVKVHSRNVSGQDVTEEYVDLESRLKSKQLVEERLLEFMENAKETKDLLQISNDLERVQTEIESIKGRMKYLENQTSLSTVTLTLFENKVDIPGLDKDKLNTWDKTKKQFMDSINFLLSATSAVVVFFVGNSPVLILLGVLGLLLWFLVRKHRKGNMHDK
jgi:major membrane immunogen (membrane-anchored lipoprotein)